MSRSGSFMWRRPVRRRAVFCAALQPGADTRIFQWREAWFSRKAPHNDPIFLFAAVGMNKHKPPFSLCVDVDEARLMWLVEKYDVEGFQDAVMMDVENTTAA